MINIGVNEATEKKWNRLDRWEIIFDKEVDMKSLTVDQYIEHARIFLEEKWIDDTKEMRDLFDSLEDKTMVGNVPSNDK